MFGKKGKLEDRLARDELQRADAEVLEVRHHGGGSVSSLRPDKFRTRVRVSVPGLAPFEAQVAISTMNLHVQPHVGATVPVAFDPDDPEELIWDEMTAGARAAAKSALDRERRERIARERHEAGLPPIAADTERDLDLEAQLRALQARKDAGELDDWAFRTQRAEIFKSRGF